MSAHQASDLEQFMEGVKRAIPGTGVSSGGPGRHDDVPYIADEPIYKDLVILERMTEPDKIVTFRVVWHDDAGNIRLAASRSAEQLGPYKGSLRLRRSTSRPSSLPSSRFSRTA